MREIVIGARFGAANDDGFDQTRLTDSTPVTQHGWYRFRHDLQIKQRRLTLDVGNIKCHSHADIFRFMHRATGSVNGSPTRHTWFDSVTVRV